MTSTIESQGAVEVGKSTGYGGKRQRWDQRQDLLRRVSRRRLAASLDSPSSSTDNITPLEQFIYPPLDEASLLTGDIIKRKENQPTRLRRFSNLDAFVRPGGKGKSVIPVARVLVSSDIRSERSRSSAIMQPPAV